MDKDRIEAGLKVRRQVLGDTYVDQVLKHTTEFSRPFQNLVSEYCWGECWTNEALSKRERSILNLGMLASLNRMEEFELHVHGALRNGLDADEIQAVLIQVAVYCGVPVGVDCFRRVGRILEDPTPERDKSNPSE